MTTQLILVWFYTNNTHSTFYALSASPFVVSAALAFLLCRLAYFRAMPSKTINSATRYRLACSPIGLDDLVGTDAPSGTKLVPIPEKEPSVPAKTSPTHRFPLPKPQSAGSVSLPPVMKDEPVVQDDNDSDDEAQTAFDRHEKARRQMLAARQRAAKQLGSSIRTIPSLAADHFERNNGVLYTGAVAGASTLWGMNLKELADARIRNISTIFNPQVGLSSQAAEGIKATIKILPDLPPKPMLTGVSPEIYSHFTGKSVEEIRNVTKGGNVMPSHLADLGAKDYHALIRCGGRYKYGSYLLCIGTVYSMCADFRTPLGRGLISITPSKVNAPAERCFVRRERSDDTNCCIVYCKLPLPANRCRLGS